MDISNNQKIYILDREYFLTKLVRKSRVRIVGGGLESCIYGLPGFRLRKIAFSLHFLYRLLVILGSELIACVISYAVCGRRVSQQSGQLLCDIKVAVWI